MSAPAESRRRIGAGGAATTTTAAAAAQEDDRKQVAAESSVAAAGAVATGDVLRLQAAGPAAGRFVFFRARAATERFLSALLEREADDKNWESLFDSLLLAGARGEGEQGQVVNGTARGGNTALPERFGGFNGSLLVQVVDPSLLLEPPPEPVDRYKQL